MKITYFLEVNSSWCHWAEPVWAELQKRYAGRVEFAWKIALMPPEAFPITRHQCEWFYRRSGSLMRSPYMLKSGWLEEERKGDYKASNLLAEAGRDFGFTDDRLRLALSKAALFEGRLMGRMEVAAEVAALVANIPAAKLLERASSTDVRFRVEASTNEFKAHQIDQRPAFILTNDIGDKAVFSGMVRLEPLQATIEAMLCDAAAYASHQAHFGTPPMV